MGEELKAKIRVDERIELRQFCEADARAIFETVRENCEHLKPFLYWVTEDYSLDSAREFIAASQKDFAEKARQGFGIFYDEKFIGAIGFVVFNWKSRRTEIGYWIAEDYEGKGIITKACQRLIDYAFGELKFNRVEIHCATENRRSCAVPEKLGFKLEGVLRESEWRHTRFYDTAIYGILATEWRR